MFYKNLKFYNNWQNAGSGFLNSAGAQSVNWLVECIECLAALCTTCLPQFQLTAKISDAAKKLRTQPCGSIVTIVLVRGTDLLPMDDNGFSDPYVKFRLGNEKYKSKVGFLFYTIYLFYWYL